MKNLLIATTNKGKIEQIKSFFEDLPLQILFLPELNIDLKVEENGKTLEENAIIKAKAYSKETGYWALADDMGMEVDFLNGEPGVKSRRWPGYEASDEELIQLTLKKLDGVPFEKRTVSFKSVIALASPEGKTQTVEGISRGYISERPSDHRISGLPFSCLFYIPKYKKIFTELTNEQKQEVSHRIKAIKIVKETIKEILC